MSGLIKFGSSCAKIMAVSAAALYVANQDEEFRKQIQFFSRSWYDKLLNHKLQYRKAAMIHAIIGDVYDLDAGVGLNLRSIFPGNDKYHAIIRTEEEKAAVHQVGSTIGRLALDTTVDHPLHFLKSLKDNSIEHFLATDIFSKLNETEYQEAIDEIYRTLKPGGKLYFSDMTLHPTSPMSSVSEMFNPIRNLIGIHRHNVLRDLLNTFPKVYCEDWSSNVDRSNPRKNIKCIISPVDPSIFTIYDPILRYRTETGELKHPSLYDATPEETVLYLGPMPPLDEQYKNINSMNLSGNMYIAGVAIKSYPRPTLDERLEITLLNNSFSFMKNHPPVKPDFKLE